MTKILFVCHGNICRSPLAQSILTHQVKALGLSHQFYIDSMATSTEEIGNPPHYGTVRKLHQQGIPLVPHRAKQITRQDYAKFDYILAMDSHNVRNLHRILGGDPAGKIHKLLAFCGSNADIADPWYTGNFDATYENAWKGCHAFLKFLGVTE